MYHTNYLSQSIDRHRVFISFKYTEHHLYKEKIEEWNNKYNIFENLSVGNHDVDDKLPSERIRQIIRDEFIKDATVLILLNGSEMRKSKFIDWELHAAMFHTPTNPKMGILVINLPDNQDGIFEDSASYPIYPFFYGGHNSKSTYEDLLRRYPNSPARLLKNIARDGVKIKNVNWSQVTPYSLKQWVHEAFLQRKTNNYDYSDPLRRRAYE